MFSLLNVGVFGDMRKFFDELKTNLDVTEAANATPSLEMNGKEENPEAQGIYHAVYFHFHPSPRE